MHPKLSLHNNYNGYVTRGEAKPPAIDLNNYVLRAKLVSGEAEFDANTFEGVFLIFEIFF